MWSCKEISVLTSKANDSRLGPWDRLAVRVHLLYCRGCRRFRDQIQFLRRAARLPDSPLAGDVHLPEVARTRIRAALRRDR